MAHYQGAVQNRRRWTRRVIIGLNIVVGTALVAAVAAVGYALFWYGSIDKLGLGLGSKSVSEPMNILVVGSDSRDDVSSEERSKFGGSVGRHSDSIMLVRLEPATKTIKTISFNRDMFMPIAGTSRKGRINEAFQQGKTVTDGARTLIDTIEQNYDVKIDHFMAVDFNGFRSVVDAIGGVPIYFDYAARDKANEYGNAGSGFSITSPGCITLHGEMALSYVRSRHYQVLTPTGWRADASSDYGRVIRQQDFMKRVAERAIAEGADSPVVAERIVRKSIRYMKIDDGFGAGDLLSLARKYKGMDPQNIKEYGFLPGKGGRTTAGASVIFPDFVTANKKLAAFRVSEKAGSSTTAARGPSSSLAPENISVFVKNGSGITGQAAAAETKLKLRGYKTLGNSSADAFSYTKSVINYSPGNIEKAKILQAQLVNGAVLVEKSGIKGDLELITGSNYSGMTATSTTVAGSSSPAAPTATTITSTETTVSQYGMPSKRNC